MPGKRTLAEELQPGPRRAPPERVADSSEDEPNAVLRVLVYNEAGEVIQRWESKGRWEGGLPQKYTATRGGKGWSWDSTGGSTVRVNTSKDGRGGSSVEAWAQAAGKKIVVHAYAASAVTFDEDAKESDEAPGHAMDPQEGGDGSTTRVNPDGNVAAQQKLSHAELAEEATDVRPVAGRLPQNHEYAGQAFPADLLPPQYRGKGLRFTKEGYPDFAPHARQLPNGKNHVEIEYTGSRRADFAAANKKAKLDQTPKGWMWHHAEDMKTMYLVPRELHKAVKHSGGVARLQAWKWSPQVWQVAGHQ